MCDASEPFEGADGWIEWHGASCPVDPSALVDVVTRNGATRLRARAGYQVWHERNPSSVARYRVRASGSPTTTKPELIGGKLPDDSYYIVRIDAPMSPGLKPYTAECADIIEALDMTFNEGEAFKALWRMCRMRQGVGKPGGGLQYDADKVAHYGGRVAVHTKRRAG